jgi:MutS2 family protein
MDEKSLCTLEYLKIKERLKEYALSNLGRKLIDAMAPAADLERANALLDETQEARELVAQSGGHPLAGLSDISECIERAARGGVLHPEDLMRTADLLRGCSKVKRFMRSKRALAPNLSGYAESITELPGVVSEIEGAVSGNAVLDSASPRLDAIRARIRVLDERIRSALQAVITSPRYRDAIQDGYISQKDGQFVVAVKASHRNLIQGSVVASSSSGATVFVEPAAVRRHSDDLRMARAEEEAEVYQILMALTGLVAQHVQEIKVNLEALGAYDLIFARARYAEQLRAARPEMVAARGQLAIRQARHPLLPQDAVPLDLEMSGGFRVLVITGPNTGGKTVALKTVGICALMAQSGLHVPAARGTILPVFADVLADIGDAQSIENSLSTFSGHMGNIARMLKMVVPGSLVLLDEIGTGTDPAEGAALACAILSELHRRGALVIATTHYGDVKRFADERPGFVNGCMEFDQETLRPLYVLAVGKAGKSQGLWIAERLGISGEVLARARRILAEARGCEETGTHSRIAAGTDVPTGALAHPATTDLQHPSGPPARAGAPRAYRRPGRDLGRLPRHQRFLPGDNVFVHSMHRRGIVAAEEDQSGNVDVVVDRVRHSINHKRLTMTGLREDLYPDLETYDLDIVLLPKEDRKLARQMERKHVEGVERIIRKGSETPAEHQK